MKPPVVLIAYKRPVHAAQVLRRIRGYRPERLYVVCDGPREPAQREACEFTRRVIDAAIDWPCDVRKNYADSNMGLSARVTSGISWAFESCESAIILEDDCLVHPDFFPFCEELLPRFSRTEDVFSICAADLARPSGSDPASYRFSGIPMIWGWATWKRAWERLEPIPGAPADADAAWLSRRLGDRRLVRYWLEVIGRVRRRQVDSWATNWCRTVLLHGGKVVVPRGNLVTNIGFAPNATHTTQLDSPLASLQTTPPPLPIVHPSATEVDRDIDRSIYEDVFGVSRRSPSLAQRIRGRIVSQRQRLRRLLSRSLHAPVPPAAPPVGRPPAAVMLRALGRQMSRQARMTPAGADLQEVEFDVHSQSGEDGILQHLIHHARVTNRRFVEFGVQDYNEANTRLLLEQDYWQGLVIDSGGAWIDAIRGSDLGWRYDLTAIHAHLTPENIDDVLAGAGFAGEIGVLSIDVDGMDYWIWERISVVRPAIVVCEYNSVFGARHAVAVIPQADFDRRLQHHSCLYFGASLAALEHLGNRLGYALVGSNSYGSNAFFVRRDCLGDLKPRPAATCYVESRFRESRNLRGELTYLGGDQRIRAIADLPAIEVTSGRVVFLGDRLGGDPTVGSHPPAGSPVA